MSKPFKILSIDGGGIKGLFSASVIAELEKKSGRLSGECFDMICGTSTGGLIALGIASGMSASQMAELYINKGGKIFATPKSKISRWWKRNVTDTAGQIFWYGKFSAKPLKHALKETFGDKTMGDLDNLVCIPSFNMIKGMPRVFKFPHKEGGFYMDKDISLIDVALATSAAPTYFPIHDIDGTLFVDGGVWANNPSQCGILEAIDYFVGEGKEYSHIELLSVASIAQANGWPSSARKKRSFIGWKGDLLQTFMDGQSFFTDFFLQKTIPKLYPDSRYIRIKSPSLSNKQTKILQMDRADEAAINTLRSLGNLEGATATGNEEIMAFYESHKTYNTKA